MNGAGSGKWPEKLAAKLGGGYKIINNSQSGRTLGFDNLGDESLNIVKQIDRILKDACVKLGNESAFDTILLCLGTNDCKACFDDQQLKVVKNMQTLITSIREYNYPQGKTPNVIISSPPAYEKTGSNSVKYKDGDKKVKALIPQFEALSKKIECGFTPLLPNVERLAVDGVHYTDEGYAIMTGLIGSAMENNY